VSREMTKRYMMDIITYADTLMLLLLVLALLGCLVLMSLARTLLSKLSLLNNLLALGVALRLVAMVIKILPFCMQLMLFIVLLISVC
jgi:hypothetical protein